MDVAKIDFSPLTIEYLQKNNGETYNFLYSSLINPQTALVFGSIKVTLLNTTGTVQIGTNGYIDTYDFDQKNGGDPFRNFATKIGNAFAGKGIGFNIYGYGFGHVNHVLKISNRAFGSRKWFL